MALHHRLFVRFSIKVTVLLSLVLLSSCGSRPTDVRSQLQKDAVDQHIRPAFQNALLAAKNLDQKIQTLCHAQKSSDALVNDAKLAWKEVALAWAAAEVFDATKLSAENVRHVMHINSFPNKRKLMQRRIHALLEDNRTLDEKWVSSAPVSYIGVSSMEYALFGDTKLPDTYHGRRCDLLKMQSYQLVKDLAAYHVLWQGTYGKDFANNSGQFKSHDLAITLWYNSVLNLLELMKDQKLGFASGLSTGNPKVHYEAPYAGISKLLYEKNFAAVKKAIIGNENSTGFLDYLQVTNHQTLASALTDQLLEVEQYLGHIKTKDFNNSSEIELELLFKAVSQLTYTFKNDVSEATGIPVTFNANDGD